VRTRLATAFADTRAADLSLAYGLAPLPALGAHAVSLPGVALELRVLGASHQVVLGDWSETVACLPERPGDLPELVESVAGDYQVRFEARCQRLAGDDLEAAVARIVADCAADEHALVGEFPGSPAAITALVARPEPGGGARWRTWHAYPQAGELVQTVSVVRPR
jgi:uncharacterized protein DUF2617